MRSIFPCSISLKVTFHIFVQLIANNYKKYEIRTIMGRDRSIFFGAGSIKRTEQKSGCGLRQWVRNINHILFLLNLNLGLKCKMKIRSIFSIFFRDREPGLLPLTPHVRPSNFCSWFMPIIDVNRQVRVDSRWEEKRMLSMRIASCSRGSLRALRNQFDNVNASVH